MTSIAFISACGAPGVTTTACAICAVWPTQREVVLVECDPSGGDIAARFGLPIEPGLTSWVLDQRARESQGVDILNHVQVLPGGLKVIVGPVGADTSVALDRELGAIDEGFDKFDLILDCGRFNPQATGQQRMLMRADNVVIVSRSDASSIAHGRRLVDTLAALRRDRPWPSANVPSGIVVVGDGPFSPDECAQALGCRLVGAVPIEREAASMFGGEPGRRRALARSSLVRTARRMAANLAMTSQEAELTNAR